MTAKPANAIEALRELVACKDLSERIGLFNVGDGLTPSEWLEHDSLVAEYERRKPLAWAAARAVLAEPPKDSNDTKSSYTDANRTAPPKDGWICPACRRVNGPQVRECACRGNLTLGERLRRANP